MHRQRTVIPGRVLFASVLATVAILATVFPCAGASDLVRGIVSGGSMSESAGSYRLTATVGEVGVIGLVEGPRNTLGLGFWQGALRLLVTEASSGDPGIRYVNGLRQNFPNPFGGDTSLSFTVGARSPVHLAVYDVGGRRVATLVETSVDPGRYSVRWDGRDEDGSLVSSGIYFYRLTIGSWTDTRKMLRLR